MMAPRSSAAALGLLAFSVSVLAGLWARNPVAAILARAIWAMIVFAFIGLLAGWAVSIVLAEHAAEKEKALRTSEDSPAEADPAPDQQKSYTEDSAEPMGT